MDWQQKTGEDSRFLNGGPFTGKRAVSIRVNYRSGILSERWSRYCARAYESIRTFRGIFWS